ncbi:MAG: ferritin-like protein [Mucilaginibacter sp.]|nr:ferritin-like protein [Mucilaginibacter sp.]
MKTELQERIPGANIARRSFLRYAGIGVASAGLLATAACHKDHKIKVQPDGIDIGITGDMAILNYVYAVEQLEAAFYTQLLLTPYAGITADEIASFTSIRDHDVVHREFFKTALGGKAIPELVIDLSSLDFTTRPSVLTAAKVFKDMGIRAYDGIGYLIATETYLTIVGKIVSVEARHSALISNITAFGTFAGNDQVDGNGFNKSSTISEILLMINPYFKIKVNAVNYGYVAS